LAEVRNVRREVVAERQADGRKYYGMFVAPLGRRSRASTSLGGSDDAPRVRNRPPEWWCASSSSTKPPPHGEQLPPASSTAGPASSSPPAGRA
jgi:hypothetical protein